MPFEVLTIRYASPTSLTPKSRKTAQFPTYRSALNNYAARVQRAMTAPDEVLLLDPSELTTDRPDMTTTEGVCRSFSNPALAAAKYTRLRVQAPVDSALLYQLHRIKMNMVGGRELSATDQETLICLLDALQDDACDVLKVPRGVVFPHSIFGTACEAERGLERHVRVLKLGTEDLTSAP